MQFVGGRPGSGRPRKPREIDVIREWIEERTGEIAAALWVTAFTAERAVVVGNGPTAHIVMVPDEPIRLASRKELLDRGYGRPQQSAEITVIAQDQVDREIAELLRKLDANDRDSGEQGVAGTSPAAQS
jgi:hypothetical protein